MEIFASVKIKLFFITYIKHFSHNLVRTPDSNCIKNLPYGLSFTTKLLKKKTNKEQDMSKL